jgi:leader peptidase (prepilin peptidase)/N-methyltransferase
VSILTIEYLILLFGLFVIGAVFGSMLNVCIYRLPREDGLWGAFKSMLHPPSHCPRCGELIRFYDNIPILGWIKLRGRCRNCRGTIAARYPLIEALTGLLFVVLFACEVPDLWGWVAHQKSSLWHVYGPTNALAPFWLVSSRYILHVVLLIALIVATFIDIDLRIIPDSVTLPAMFIALVAHTILGNVYIVPLWYQTPEMAGAAWGFFAPLQGLLQGLAGIGWLAGWPQMQGVPLWIAGHPHLHGLCVSLAGIIVGGGSIWAVRLAGFWALKREAMGFGDVVLMAMIGSFIGWQGTLIVFFLAMILAVSISVPAWFFHRDHELPFGPYLAGGTLLLLLTGRFTWPWFEVRFLAMGPMLVPMALILMLLLAGTLIGWRKTQKLLGIAPPEQEWIEETRWESGDQLAYLANQAFDDRQGQWRRPEWPGRLAARGQIHYRAWRHGD